MTKTALGCAIAVALTLFSCNAWRKAVVEFSTPDTFRPQGDPSVMEAVYDGPDASRERIEIRLQPVVSGYDMPTDVQFVPGRDDIMVVLEKNGRARWASLQAGAVGELLEVEVLKDSEQGLLGLAFHPAFAANGLFYVNYTAADNRREVSRIEEWRTAVGKDGRLSAAEPQRVILQIEQPYANHNAGQLQFGPDGFLYVGFGDGGWRGDPKQNAQKRSTMLGTMLRIDVDGREGAKQYGIPADNPFVGDSDALPEVWAYGLRNPWRYSFAPDGRLVIGDVGQELWEEITVSSTGDNHGWNIREGRHCFDPKAGCSTAGLTEPVYEYPHGEDGRSVTGGYHYLSARVPKLRGKYVFGDFISGRLWAIDISDKGTTEAAKAYTLGRWPILPSTFGRNGAGEVFVADFSSGKVFAILPPESNISASRKRKTVNGKR